MKLLRVFFFCCLSLGLLYSVSAKPLTTEKIVFSSYRNGNFEIYMMNPDGSQQVRLTNHRADDLNPVCSPTGEEILFVSDRGGERDLYIMRADGGGERPVFRTAPAYRDTPAWAPDNEKSHHFEPVRSHKIAKSENGEVIRIDIDRPVRILQVSIYANRDLAGATREPLTGKTKVSFEDIVIREIRVYQ